MGRFSKIGVVAGILLLVAATWLVLPPDRERFQEVPRKPDQSSPSSKELEMKGRDIFRHDTYGNEVYFTDVIDLPFKTLLAIPAATREKTLGVLTDKNGKELFEGKANCDRCHTPPKYTNNKKVKPEEVGTDPKHANSPVFKDGTYKVPQLLGVWAVGPYFHDGSAKRLIDVVNHYDQHFNLDLTNAEKDDLVEFLKSLH